jgi:tetratricopeptide (TPR) repeat protein
MLLAIAAATALAVAQPAAEPKSPYLDVVRSYGPGTEPAAVDALFALKITKASRVFEDLDDRVCRAAGADGCDTPHLIAAGPAARARVAAAWRRLYPRALALHVDALAASNPFRRPEDINDDRVLPTDASVQVSVLLHLARRLEAIAAEPDVPDTFTALAAQARRLLVWTLQYLRADAGLAAALDAIGPPARTDVDLRLARAMVDELRTDRMNILRTGRIADSAAFRREMSVAQEERRRLESAVRGYEALLADHPGLLEAHLRIGPLLLRLDRVAEAEQHLERAAGLAPDGRQAYLIALFLADAYERRGRLEDAVAAYGVARQRMPLAQTPLVALARLHALRGRMADARAALAALDDGAAAAAPVRPDPWLGYVGGQALEAAFESGP